jgi:hypothetical protein
MAVQIVNVELIMWLALLINFGSTYTKVTAIDLNKGSFLVRAQVPSTVATNVLNGFEEAQRSFASQLGFGDSDVGLKLARSIKQHFSPNSKSPIMNQVQSSRRKCNGSY